MANGPHGDAFHQWCQASRNFLQQSPDGWVVPQPAVVLKMKDTNSVAATNFTVGSDAAISFSDEAKEEVKVTLRLPGMWLSAIRLDIVPQATNVVKGTAIKSWKSAALAVSAVLQSAERGSEPLILINLPPAMA